MFEIKKTVTKFNLNFFLNLLLAFAALVLITRYQYHLLTYLEWEDEITHIITSRLIVNGSQLYSQIYELHGPLTFLSGVILESLLPSSGISIHRVPIALLQWCALLSIFFSPLIKNHSTLARITYCIGYATYINIYFSDIFGHTYLFQNIAGYLLIIILAQYTLPSINDDQNLSKGRVILGSMLIGALPFLAFTYIPIAAALFLCSTRKRYFKSATISIAASCLMNIFFLVCIGSIPGYFAMHFWNNLFVTREFVDGSAIGFNFFIKTIWSSITSDNARFAIFCSLIICIANIADLNKRSQLYRTLILTLGISSLLLRAKGFQGLPFLYVSLAMLLIPISKLNATRVTSYMLLPIAFVGLLKFFLLSPANILDRQIRHDSTFSQLARQLTSKEDKIVSWPFQNMEYILANRLPATGNFFYSPWQAAYYDQPVLNIKIDSCDDIKEAKPKIMLVTKYEMNNVAWEQYTPICFQDLLKNDYSLVPNTSIYLRRDVGGSK